MFLYLRLALVSSFVCFSTGVSLSGETLLEMWTGASVIVGFDLLPLESYQATLGSRLLAARGNTSITVKAGRGIAKHQTHIVYAAEQEEGREAIVNGLAC